MYLAWDFVYLVAGLCRGQGHLSVAADTIENFVARAIRLYEQEPGEALASARLGLYVRRWFSWARLGAPRGPCEMAGGAPE
jgi:hypothetical protein